LEYTARPAGVAVVGEWNLIVICCNILVLAGDGG